MPGKVQAYVEMANETAASITQDAEAWMQFLRHSARFYKYASSSISVRFFKGNTFIGILVPFTWIRLRTDMRIAKISE